MFYQPPEDDRIWFYAERGLMSYLFQSILAHNLTLVLDHAVNLNGQNLGDVIGRGRRHRVLTEFDLGKAGFGSPDGAIVVGLDEPNPFFVFVEAKQVPYAASFRSPQLWAWVQNQMGQQGGDRIVRAAVAGFNSSINGQLELRWRFVNSLNAAGGNAVVSEQAVQHLPEELMANDVFYLRSAFAPNPIHQAHWRAVGIAGQLAPLYQLLQTIQQFFLLAITADSQLPAQLIQQTRLFQGDGQQRVAVNDRLFWMPWNVVEQQLIHV